jgi:hypothetical protein
MYHKHFPFQDTSDLKYIGMQRHFKSFQEAAGEASISRVHEVFITEPALRHELLRVKKWAN